jgi:hypothetical protein
MKRSLLILLLAALTAEAHEVDQTSTQGCDHDVLLAMRLGPAYDFEGWKPCLSYGFGFDIAEEDYLTLILQGISSEQRSRSLSVLVGLDTYRFSSSPLMLNMGAFLGYTVQRSIVETGHREDEWEISRQYLCCAARLGAGLHLPAHNHLVNDSNLALDLTVLGLFRRGEGKLALTLQLGLVFLL